MMHEFWTIAYRSRGEKPVFEDVSAPFRVIPNTWRYWCADPHFFEHEGKTWVFAELYDRVLRRGVIGCCCLEEKGSTKWKVALKMPFHLSYPHIFRRGDGIYMIPESYMGGEVALYKATAFPYCWQRVKALWENAVAVDTTRIPWLDKTWLLAQAEVNGSDKLLLMTEGGERQWVVDEDSALTRPAGPVLRYNGALIRPAQDCSDGYGRALRFNEILEVGEGVYREKLMAQVCPEQITSDWNHRPEGIHTYGQTEKYEIIDLKSMEKDPLFIIMRPIWYIWRRIKRLVRK